jgi:hypothetical protein
MAQSLLLSRRDAKAYFLITGALTAMDALRAAAAMAQFLTLIRTCPNTAAVTMLTQSINVWLAYYPLLQTVLGGYSPSIVTFIHAEFYAFTLAMLDAITATFCGFFGLPWTGKGVSHTHLTNEFPRLCATYQFRGDSQNLLTQMRDLRARIPYQSADTLQGVAHSSGDTLTELVRRLDHYIVAMCEFLSANLEHSVLHLTPHQEER